MDLPSDCETVYDSVYVRADPDLLTCVSGFTLDLLCHRKLDLQLAPTAPYIKSVTAGNWSGLLEMQGFILS